MRAIAVPWKLLCRILLVIALPALASAQPPITAPVATVEEPEEEVRAPSFLQMAVMIFGGGSTYGMEELNKRDEEIFNVLFGPIVPGASPPKIERGMSGGAGLRLVLADRFVVDAAYERLLASTDFGGETVTWDISAPADAMTFMLGYDLVPSPNTRFGFGAGLGKYYSRMSSSFDWTGPMSPQEEILIQQLEDALTADIEGSTWGHQFEAFFEVRASPTVHVNGIAGYRKAKLGDGTVNGEPAIELDWSGFRGYIGFSYYFRT